MVGVEQWAEIRRLVLVEQRSQRQVAKSLGLARDTVARALASDAPPRYVRAVAGSKLDPFQGVDLRAAADQPNRSSRCGCGRWRSSLAMRVARPIFDDYVREVRPRFEVRRTFQRTLYRPGELVQCDLWEPAEQVAVGHGQRRRGWVVTSEVCWSRAIAGTLMFSKEAPDILWGLARNLGSVGGVAGEAGVGSRSGDRGRWSPDRRVRGVLRAAGGRVGDPRGRAIRRPRARWSARTGSCAPTSSPAGCSPTMWTSKTGLTPG